MARGDPRRALGTAHLKHGSCWDQPLQSVVLTAPQTTALGREEGKPEHGTSEVYVSKVQECVVNGSSKTRVPAQSGIPPFSAAHKR